MLYLSERINGEQRITEVPEPAFAAAYDVIVCGLGTAGSFAALFSAENGLNVLGIETFTCVGGTHTAGGVGGHYFGFPGGRYETLDREVKACAGQYKCPVTEARKLVTEEALRKNGVHIQYEALVCGVYLEDNRVVGVKVLKDQKLIDYKTKILMDCTAEAHVAVLAGCSTEYGRESDGQTQPYSMVELYWNGKDYVCSNRDCGRVDQRDEWALSEALIFSRSSDADEIRNDRKRITQMPLIGIREGRRIVSEERVKVQDLFADVVTEEPMFFSYADLDMHGWDVAFDGESMGDWTIGANLGAYNATIAVSYKAILPVGIEGLLVPCRALGVDRDISSCVRMNPDMKKVAEAAAEWADLAVKQEKSLREVSYAELRERLEKSGCLNRRTCTTFYIDGWTKWDGSPVIKEEVRWMERPEDLETRLATDCPGQAIWSARRIGEEVLPVLIPLLKSENEHLKKHAAFAIACVGSNAANTVLREMVNERDGFMLKDCRKHNKLRGCMAIYWLGRLADETIAGELLKMISDEKEIEKPVYHQQGILTTRYEIKDFNNLYFQFMSQAVMALVRIGRAHPSLRGKIGETFCRVFEGTEFYDRITTRHPKSSEGNMVLAMKTVALSAVREWT